ncbi:MAG: hypothetical protein IJ828_11135 [Treponema sp.]|nr:hypothetical protein [Treponema sp.]
MRHTKIVSAVLIPIAALLFSCSTGDSSDSSSFDSPAAVVKGASQSADMSTSGVSRAINYNSDSNPDAMVGKLTGESDTTAMIFSMLGKIADAEKLSGVAFNNPVNLDFTANGITVQRLQVNQEGSLFYIYSSGTYSGNAFSFALKCTENAYGTLDTSLYFPSQYTELVQYKRSGSGKTRFMYRVNTNDPQKEDYYRVTATSGGNIEGYLYQTAESGLKSTFSIFIFRPISSSEWSTM